MHGMTTATPRTRAEGPLRAPHATLSGPFALALESRRARYNALFADAHRTRPSLDAEAFAAHLRVVVAPIVDRAASHAPTAAAPVTDALYELSLDLVGQEFLGPRSRYPALVEGWQHLLVALAPRVAEAPRLLPGAVTNALYQLATTPGARPREWMQALVTLSPLCADVDTLLQAAQVVAWRAGLAHYRASALRRCAGLDPAAGLVALGIPIADRPPVSPDLFQAALARLQTDPWLDPAAALRDDIPARRLQLIRRVGAFRGFGGQFLAPPTISVVDGQFVVSDGDTHWRLFADRFGATLHRTVAPSRDKTKRKRHRFTLSPEGEVKHGSARVTFPELANCTTSAEDDTTLAVTTPLSHGVFLVALVSSHLAG
jgi:hypothetical protein